MQSLAAKLLRLLLIAAAAISSIVHIATFLTIVPFLWLIPAFVCFFGAVLCTKALESKGSIRKASGPAVWIGLSLLAYSILTFVYFRQTTGGATGVGIVNGAFVTMDHHKVIRTISEQEYRMIPTLWLRVMSAWMLTMAVFGWNGSPSKTGT